MIHKLEGSITVGTTGTISALMTHELSIPQTPVPRKRPHTVPVSVYCGVTTKMLQPRRTLSYRMSTPEKVSNANRTRSINKTILRTRDIGHRLPMLSSEDVSKDRTPNRGKTTKKRYHVEIVDFKCGNSDKAWSRPISDQFRKLSFSRLSD
ncbi:hypothetical protein Acr_12g0000330 [Actinidia rufa]|uniref:Uncharacterized protein n=1 Tax=Actinidia rufa TaxID=165716 RepID=A0A7J0FFM2_9ERIC|nr:hypothetical protein Acr_12g0000330 [Actinidia rufa]